MKNTLLSSIVVAICLSCLSAAADVKIERAQRKFQARYFFLTSNYVTWPDCTCGKAPNFPMDGFYGDIAKNPALGVRLVKHLAGKFFESGGGGCRDFYGSFLKEETVEHPIIEGRFAVEDFPEYRMFFTAGPGGMPGYDFDLNLPGQITEKNFADLI